MKLVLRNNSGFTLIELLVAMALFSFLLLLVSTGFIGIVRYYQGGIAQRSVQQNARIMLDDMTKAIRTANDITVVQRHDTSGVMRQDLLCLHTSSGMIVYAVDDNATGSRLHQGTLASGAPCAYSAVAIGSWRVIGDSNAYLGAFTVDTTDRVGVSLQTATISITTGSVFAQDLTAPDSASHDLKCLPAAGSQNCSVAHFETTVQLRGGS